MTGTIFFGGVVPVFMRLQTGIGGNICRLLREADAELYQQCRDADTCVIIKGQVEEDSDLDYMRNVIGIVQAFMEQGAAGVLDLPTFTLFSPEQWKDRFFEKEVNAQNHVIILYSEEPDGYWLHTRSGNTYEVESKFVDDFDNDDFNNAYCEIDILQD